MTMLDSKEGDHDGTFIPVAWDIETTTTNPMDSYAWYNDEEPMVGTIGFCVPWGWSEATEVRELVLDTNLCYGPNETKTLYTAKHGLQNIVHRVREESEHDGIALVSFSGNDFDHPYVGARAATHGISMDLFTDVCPRVDMADVITEVEGFNQYSSQDDVAEHYGHDMEDPCDGSEMPDLIKSGHWEKVNHHCETDVLELMRITFENRDLVSERLDTTVNLDS